MTLASQFGAARQIHAAMEADGESPERLGGLVRAYAHLALLTEHLWSTDSKVFKARALLYAERLRFHRPDEAWGGLASCLRRRAGRALGGGAGGPPASARRRGDTRPPEWVAVIEPLCRFDDAELAKQADRPGLQGLVHFLQYIVVEDLNADQPGIAQAGCCCETIRPAPECVTVSRHSARENWPQRRGSLSAGVCPDPPAQLGTMPGLPKAARSALASAPTPWHALQTAGDTDGGEPSWGSLGHLLREDRFASMWCRAALMEPDAPDFVLLGASRAIFKDHPLGDLLELYGLDPRREREAYPKRSRCPAARGPANPSHGHLPRLHHGAAGAGPAISQRAFRPSRPLQPGLRGVPVLHRRRECPGIVREGDARISPHAPSAIEVLMRWDGANQPAGQIAAWEKSESHQAPVLRGFVARAQAAGNAGAIERALRRYLARAGLSRLSPAREPLPRAGENGPLASHAGGMPEAARPGSES